MQKFLHPQSIVQITTIAIPATARRVVAPYMVWKFFTCDDVVGRKVRFANIKESFGFFIHRCTESNCHSAKNISPATRPWVGSVAQKAPAFSYSRTESNKTSTAIPKPPPAQGATASGAKIKFLRRFFQEATRRRPPVKN